MIKIDIDERKWKKIKEEHSEWYCKKIFPRIKKAFEELKKLYEDKFSDYEEFERYIEMLKKNSSRRERVCYKRRIIFGL